MAAEIQEVVRPYELLIRWGDGGVIGGAHVRFLSEVKRGDEILSAREGAPIPVALAGQQGFPIDDLLTAAQSAAFATAAHMEKQLEEERARTRELNAKLEEQAAKAEALGAEASHLRQRLAVRELDLAAAADSLQFLRDTNSALRGRLENAGSN